MNKILKYLKNYISKEINLIYLLVILIITGIFIYINYHYKFPKSWINVSEGFTEYFVKYFIFYLLCILIPIVILYLFERDSKLLQTKVWVIIVFACAVFSLRSSFSYHNVLISEWMKDNQELKSLAYECSQNLVGFLLTIVPIFLFWLFNHRQEMPFYGFSTKNFEFKPYWILLGLMVPLIIWASFQTDFLQQYPKAYNVAHYHDINAHNWKQLTLFEICYGIDFISIESFFRGFLVILLGRLCGYKILIPIACFYVGIHFWKPMAETASSFFGGLILSVLAFETRSIYGGIMVHMGIAWLMEIGAIIGRNFIEP